MQIPWGQNVLELELLADRQPAVTGPEHGPAITDVVEAAADALEHPFAFPALRRALTPEDRLVVVIDPALASPAPLLTALLRHVTQARVDPPAVTLLCPQADQDQRWLDDLPEEFQEVRTEVHTPADRQHLAYLATTKGGRRVYINRTAVDADQVVVLTRRSFDSRPGHAGGPGVIFPGLSD